MLRLLLVLCSSVLAVQALVPGRVAAPRGARPGPAAVGAAAQIVMQVQAPVKTPTIELAPTEPKNDASSAKGKKFKLLLFNDNMNKREYVAKILQATVPGLTAADAYVIMQKAHQNGMAVVGVWVFELAEAYCDQLKAGGLIASVTAED
mmetsp:Transcript_34845/g.112376  ORF Transcript_34845/g.112376 Transcript_34845/m.112376 type:complete len:149 (-) Transcript_34845:568-1014(-)